MRRTVLIQPKRTAASVTGTDLIMNQTGSRYILPANEVLTHDADGNLTNDGHWIYTWDAENRLISLEEKTSTRQPPGLMVRQRLEFRYDAGGRRIAKKVLHAEGNGNFVLKSSQVFLYDGWSMIGELQLKESGTGLQPVIQRTYEWGPDVSGSFTGAGGVGGLILLRQVSQQSQTTANNSNPPPTSFAPIYDGNGNVTELCALSTSTVSARYEYSAFGETITVDGSAIADSNPFRFSTKYEDRETGFYYYGYRYYAPDTGRWLSRDPINEVGFRQAQGRGKGMSLREETNLYRMVHNDPINRIDLLGLLSTAKFIWWYETKFGATYDMVAEGELGQLRGLSGMQTAEEKIFKNAALSMKINAINFCSGKTGKHTYHYSNRGNREHADLTFAGNFWIGDTTLLWGLEGDIEVNCPCSFKYTGPLKMSLRDRGEDPLDIGIETGVPYSITADWETTPNIGGRLNDYR